MSSNDLQVEGQGKPGEPVQGKLEPGIGGVVPTFKKILSNIFRWHNEVLKAWCKPRRGEPCKDGVDRCSGETCFG